MTIEELEARVRKLEDIDEIHKLKATYCLLCDAGLKDERNRDELSLESSEAGNRGERHCRRLVGEDLAGPAAINAHLPPCGEVGEALGQEDETLGRELEPFQEWCVEHEDDRQRGMRRQSRIAITQRFCRQPYDPRLR